MQLQTFFLFLLLTCGVLDESPVGSCSRFDYAGYMYTGITGWHRSRGWTLSVESKFDSRFQIGRLCRFHMGRDSYTYFSSTYVEQTILDIELHHDCTYYYHTISDYLTYWPSAFNHQAALRLWFRLVEWNHFQQITLTYHRRVGDFKRAILVSKEETKK